MKKISLCLISALLFSLTGFSQLSGPKAIPGDYATIALAIADLNAVGVAPPGVTFTIASGYTETFASPTDGLITATGTTPNDQIIFQATTGGTRPVITSATGTSTTVDGIIVIRGGNYITFDGIDLQENPANTTSTMQMEWGYALVKVDGTNGAQNNTIKNCTITLNKANVASAGIYSGNHTEANLTALTVTDVAGANSNNKIYGNTISNAFSGIYVKGFADVSPYTYYDQNNEIGVTAGNTVSNYGGGATCYAIYLSNNNAAAISNNIITNTGTTSTLRGIYLAATTNANVNVTFNNISLNSGAATNQCTGIENAITGTTNTININNNNIHDCVYATATTGTFQGILSGANSAAVLNINNNTIANNTLAGTGAMTLIDGSSATNITMNSNIVNNNIKTGASGTMYCTRASTSIITFSLNQIFDNGFTATSGASAANIYGYYNLGSPTVENYINNAIYNLVITGSSTSTSCIIYGIYSWTIASSNITATINAVYGLTYNNSSTGAATIQGIRFATGNINLFKNAVFANTSNGAGSTIHGIYIAGGALWNIYNNEIFDLKAPSANLANAVNGIYIGGGTNVNVYYNSIYLNASSTGALFGTSGIYASTTPTVDLRNNIVVNVSSFAGATGYTVAYRRSGTTLTSYASTSNNNDFYSGTPGANNLIYYDGTNADQTMGAFQSRVTPRDAVSISENPPFVNVTIPPYDLRLQTTIATLCESGGQQITTPIAITDDIEGQVRWGETGYTGTGTSTDIGADEFDGIKPACLPPTTLNASAITSNSATLGWIAGGTEALWNLEWGTFGFVQGTGTSVSGLSATTYNLSGLIGNTAYSFYVQADCGGSTSTWSGPFSFTTLCDPYTIPYSEGFESITANNQLPACMAATSLGSKNLTYIAATTYNRTPHTGTNFASFAWAPLGNWFFFAPIQLTGGVSYDASTWYITDGATGFDSLNIAFGTSQSAGSMTNITKIVNPTNTTYQQLKGTFVPSTTGIYYIGIQANGTSSVPWYLTIDDILVELTPSCIAPTALTATSVTTNSATLGWTAGGSETLWNIEWGTTGFIQGTGTTVSGLTANSYNLTGLTAATSYDFYVQADCGGGNTSTWTGPYSFTTLCNNVNTFPFVESFDGVAYAPICWSNIKTAGTGNPGIWDRQTAGTNPTCAPHSGAAMSRYASYNYSAGTTGILVTPGLDLPSDLYEVRFWMYRDNGYATNTDLVNIYYNTSPNTTGATLLGTINRSNTLTPVEATPNQWYEYAYNMPAGSTGTGRYVIFEAVSDYGNNIFIDDVQIQIQPACPAPSLLTATSITTTSASLGWIAGGSETLWNIEWGTTGFVQGTGTMISGLTSNNYNLTGLTANTGYSFYVQADCGGSTSTWSGPFDFTTLCDAVNIPYIENFDAATPPALASCMSGTNDNSDGYVWNTVTGYANSAPNSMGIGYNTTLAMNDWFYTPGLNLLVSKVYKVSLAYRARSASFPEKLEVKWGASPDAASMTSSQIFNDSNVVNTVYSNANGIFTIPSDGIYYVGFHGYSAMDEWYLYVDDIAVTEASNANSLLTFDIPAQTSSTVGANTVDILMPCGTDATSLTPTITVSPGATIFPASGIAQDFTFPVTYTVTAEDGITTSTWTVSVTVPASPIVDLGTDVNQCGGTVTLDAANVGSTYIWNDATTAQTLVVSTTGTYSVTVTNTDGCSAIDTIIVNINSILPTVTLTSPSAVTICQGDTTNIDLAFTGTAPWTWVGDDGSGAVSFNAPTSPQTSLVAPSVTTTYSVISVTDATGCSSTSTESVVVTVNSAPVVNFGSDMNICDGSTTILDAGNAGSTYFWSDGSTNQTLTVTTSGTYSVTVTNTNSCSAIDTIIVTFVTPAPVTITDVLGTLASDANTGNQWYEQTIGILAGEINQTYVPTSSGNYYVIVTDVNGCTSMSNVISFLISANTISSSSSIIVYPNPANDKVWIEVANKNASQTRIEIRTLDGKLLFENQSNNLGNTKISVDLKEFASGAYIIKVISDENTTIKKLFVK